jgi:hypothetical protein
MFGLAGSVKAGDPKLCSEKGHSDLEAAINGYVKRPSLMRTYSFNSVEMDLNEADCNPVSRVWSVPIRLISDNGSVERFEAMVSCDGGTELSHDEAL